MAKPRIFVSSTYYDLKHVRSSLDLFVESLGFESIVSEKGDIAYAPDVPLDESCYREASGADIFVLIIGGRYGSEASTDGIPSTHGFYERYDSITKKEYEEAIKRDVPTYILIESSVYSEFRTFQKNKDSSSIKYAHVDSANVFRLIESILSKPKNNPVHSFDKFSDIESWLREQWAGLFRELLTRMSNQRQLIELSNQVEDIKELNSTLRTYLETVMAKVAPTESENIIKTEAKRHRDRELQHNRWVHTMLSYGFDLEDVKRLIATSRSLDDFMAKAAKVSNSYEKAKKMYETLTDIAIALDEFNEVRDMLGKPPLYPR